jgi:hypothetical protein
MSADLRVPMELVTDAFGVMASIETPDGETYSGVPVVWIPVGPAHEGAMPLRPGPTGLDLQRHEPIRALTIRRSDVPIVPRGTRIEAPEMAGGDVREWRVDAVDHTEADHVRVLVVPGDSEL